MEPEEHLDDRFPEILGKSRAVAAVLDIVGRVAPLDSPVHVAGESGTGKELVARALHARSGKQDRPFVPVNCGATPPGLFESLFFGHEKGSFTDAHESRAGYFLLADGGTLFLDEVDELSAEMQAKLLRAIEDSKVRPVGANLELPFTVRLVSASNRSLDRLVSRREFREDLFYRLHVIHIDLPPLRDRLEDVPLLAAAFLRSAARKAGIPAPLLGDDTISLFLSYPWPGNVRQLRNEIERLVAFLPGGSESPKRITAEMVDAKIRGKVPATGSVTLSDALGNLTRQIVSASMKRHGDNKTHVAKELGISRNYLLKILREMKKAAR